MLRFTATLDLETPDETPATGPITEADMRRAVKLLATPPNGWPKVLRVNVVQTHPERLL